MIMTKYGLMDEAELIHVTRVWNNAHEYTVRSEYRKNGEEVQSDVHVTLKEVPAIFAETGVLGG